MLFLSLLEDSDAAAERGLVVGLPSRGLDGRFHPGLRQAGGDDPDAPHGFVDFRRWHSNLDTVGIPTGLRVRMWNREQCEMLT